MKGIEHSTARVPQASTGKRPADPEELPRIERRDLSAPLPEEARRGGPPAPSTWPEDFDPQPMVGWFCPSVLLGAAREVVLSGLFAAFADKREQQGGLPARSWDASGLAEDGCLWLDYASDTGDGFDTTYAIAHLLGREALPGHEDLKRGEILVLGGDQVYPSADWAAYRKRFVLPYTASLPWVDPAKPPPYLFALPGNHDWYDGLTSFMRLFCQRGWIGGWRTEQTRSYFALKLVGGWWLWAVDTQFDTYVDAPQLSYFRRMSEALRRDDKVILVTAKPSWVAVPGERDTPQAWRTLAMLEDLVTEKKATVPLTLTGDLHHYSRYSGPGDDPRRHKVTAGGAGAYLSATHPLPGQLRLPDHRRLAGSPDGTHEDWERCKTWPSDDVSEKIAGSLTGGEIRRTTPSFAKLTAAVYGVIAFLWVVAWESGFFGQLALVAVFCLLLKGLRRYSLVDLSSGEGAKLRRQRLTYGSLHTVMHFVPALAAGTLVALWLGEAPGWLTSLILWLGVAPGWLSFLEALLGGALGALLGAGLGPRIFARYLRAANKANSRWHANEVFAAQSRTNGRRYKHFLRIRLDATGSAHVYAIGLPEVPAYEQGEWVGAYPSLGSSDPWVVPTGDPKPEIFDDFPVA